MGPGAADEPATERLGYVTLVILGFGLQDGLWNHTVKLAVFFLRGADRANMAGLPFRPVGSVFHEITGVLTFVAANFAAYFGYQFITQPASCRPRRGVSARRGHDWFPGCAAQQ